MYFDEVYRRTVLQPQVGCRGRRSHNGQAIQVGTRRLDACRDNSAMRGRGVSSSASASASSASASAPPARPKLLLSEAEIRAFLDTLHPALRGEDTPALAAAEELASQSSQYSLSGPVDARSALSEFDALQYAAGLFFRVSSSGDGLAPIPPHRIEEVLDLEERMRRSYELMEANMAKQLTEEHATFFGAVTHTAQLHTALRAAVSNVAHARVNMEGAVKRASASGKEFQRIQRQKQFLLDVQNAVQTMRKLLALQSDAERELQRGNYTAALTNCKAYERTLNGFEASCTTLPRKDNNGSQDLLPHTRNGPLAQIRILKTANENISRISVEALACMHAGVRSLCTNFDEIEYAKLFASYNELHSTEDLMTRLVQEFTSEAREANASCAAQIQRDRNTDVVALILALARRLLSLMLSYRSMYIFHTQRTQGVPFDASSVSGQDHQEQHVFCAAALRSASLELSDTVQSHTLELLRSAEQQLKALRPLTIMQVYLLQRRLVAFCILFEDLNLSLGADGSSHNEPQSVLDQRVCDSAVVRQLTQIAEASFEHSHKQNMELMRVMLRNESWQRCDVQVADIVSLGECMRSWNEESEQLWDRQVFLDVALLTSAIEKCDVSVLSEGVVSLNVSSETVNHRGPHIEVGDISQEPTSWKVPPDLTSNAIAVEDIEWAGSRAFTPSSLAAFRWITKYIQVGRSFPVLALQIAEAIADLFLQYVFHVSELCACRRPKFAYWREIAPRLGLVPREEPSRKLLDHFLEPMHRVILSQVRNRYLFAASGKESGKGATKNSGAASPGVVGALRELSLGEICTAVESMWTLAALTEPLLPSLQGRIASKAVKSQAVRLFSSALNVASPIRTSVYAMICRDIIGTEWVISLISRESKFSVVSSDPTVVAGAAQPSEFVEHVLAACKASALSELHRYKVPTESKELLSFQLCLGVMDTVLEGYSEVQCSSEGRAQMLFDNECLAVGLSDITGLTPVPGLDKANAFVRAHLMQLDQFLLWVAHDAAPLGFNLIQVLTIARNGYGKEVPADKQGELVLAVKRVFESGRADKVPKFLLERPPPVMEKQTPRAPRGSRDEASLPVNGSKTSSQRAAISTEAVLSPVSKQAQVTVHSASTRKEQPTQAHLQSRDQNSGTLARPSKVDAAVTDLCLDLDAPKLSPAQGEDSIGRPDVSDFNPARTHELVQPMKVENSVNLPLTPGAARSERVDACLSTDLSSDMKAISEEVLPPPLHLVNESREVLSDSEGGDVTKGSGTSFVATELDSHLANEDHGQRDSEDIQETTALEPRADETVARSQVLPVEASTPRLEAQEDHHALANLESRPTHGSGSNTPSWTAFAIKEAESDDTDASNT
ncbi:Syndetin [Porphyridium purpureum]|uniref:Syndetin n=1 Tax=Porphyridium purpureum TaxID=35688 RepID=A0A5J4YZK2_PORPP|nr:Syndetin [Porphyridium purpureum]|eukprot:POR8512..scf208_2